jgi:CBS domain-containing protein
MTFPVNHSEVVIYPKTDDAVLNKEAFKTWQFIRLPKELGGDRNDSLSGHSSNACTGQRIPVGIITERDIIFRVVAQNRGPFNVTKSHGDPQRI